MDGSRDEMVMCGGSWGGMEMQYAEMGTKLRDRELRGGKTEVMEGQTGAQKRGTDEWTDRSQRLRLGMDSGKEWAGV